MIAEIVKDRYNLQILTDLGVAAKISQLNELVWSSSLSIKSQSLFSIGKS